MNDVIQQNNYRLICDLLAATYHNAVPDEVDDLSFRRDVERHGVYGLIYAALRRQPLISASLYDDLEKTARAYIVWELRHADLLRTLIEILASKGMPWLLIKGTALAYCDYQEPWMRNRGDTDILVRQEDRALAVEALLESGFRPTLDTQEREWSSYQTNYSAQARDGGNHAIDLHWSILNSALLSRILSFDEVWSMRRPVEKLGKNVWTLSPVHALILASVHRRIHEVSPYYVGDEVLYDGDRLIWLYDIHLLALRMRSDEWRHLVELSNRKGVSRVVVDALKRASGDFGTPLPCEVVSVLEQDERESEVLKYLGSGRTRRELKDLLALESCRIRFAFVKEVLFPPARYWSDKERGRRPLVLIYVSRIARGIIKRVWGSRAS